MLLDDVRELVDDVRELAWDRLAPLPSQFFQHSIKLLEIWRIFDRRLAISPFFSAPPYHFQPFGCEVVKVVFSVFVISLLIFKQAVLNKKKIEELSMRS